MAYCDCSAWDQLIERFMIVALFIGCSKRKFSLGCRYYCESGDVQGTLGKMPSYKVRETLVLKALHRHGTDEVWNEGVDFNVFIYIYALMWTKQACIRAAEEL